MPYLYDMPGRFKISVADWEKDLSHLRFTVDTPADLEVANQVYAKFDDQDDFTLQDLLAANALHPEWQTQLAGVKHKDLFEVDHRAKKLDIGQTAERNEPGHDN